MNVAYNRDCLEAMREMPDNFFDLACVDPPYGDAGDADAFEQEVGAHFVGRGRSKRYADIAVDGKPSPRLRCHGGDRWDKYSMDALSKRVNTSERSVERTGGTWAEKYGKKIIAWDIAPGKEYFDELFRVSRNQIIWGGNYFSLPPTRCFLVWRKLTISESFSMAMAEYAWTSFNANAKIFEAAPQGKKYDTRFHPCLPDGTLVRFDGQWMPIENVRVGARNEFGAVSAITTHSAEKMVVIYAGGKRVKATWNHPFLVKRGDGIYWVNAEQVKKGDELLSLWKTDMLSQKGDICDTEQTGKELGWSTVSSGKKIMGRFHKVCKSITKTTTRQITIFPISCLSRPLNTSGCTRVAALSTAFGISPVRVAESSSPSRKKTGISTERRGGLLHRIAAPAMSKRLLKNAVCVSQTVGSVKIIREKTKVYNLTIDGIPAFETEIGITHNTQKPIDLYRWIFQNYAKPGDKILDTHLGSGSSRIAAYDAGLDFWGYEIDPTYFALEEERFETYTAQTSLFVDNDIDK